MSSAQSFGGGRGRASRGRGRPRGSGLGRGRGGSRAPTRRAPAPVPVPALAPLPAAPAAPPVPAWSAGPEQERRFRTDDVSLFESGNFADATVEGLKKKWSVHREGQTNHIKLADHDDEDIETMIRFVYAGTLDPEKFHLDNGSFTMYTNLYNLGLYFKLTTLQTDALTFIGRYADIKLKTLCSYDPQLSGRSGVVSDTSSPAPFIEDLLRAIWKAYTVSTEPNELHKLLATFVFAGRNRLLLEDGFVELANTVPMFGTEMFKLMLRETRSAFCPPDTSIRRVACGFDHAHKSQHPDRCGHCNEVFDDQTNRKAMYSPFEGALRPVTYCSECVGKGENEEVPLWRVPPEFRGV
ncbi:hypothetical protein OQA88_11628 [Cercophora sp. LCS_1]